MLRSRVDLRKLEDAGHAGAQRPNDDKEAASQFMPRRPKAAKKPYSPPSHVVLDASAAKAKLKVNGDPKDPNTQKMLSFVDEQLNRQKAKSHS